MTDETFQSRNNTYRVTGGSAPHKPSSQGKIFTDDGGVLYPSVLGLKWVPLTEVEPDIRGPLSEVLKAFCGKADLPLFSADELLLETSEPKHRAFLTAYLDLWRAMENL
jgi:hypothetical protein